MPFGGKAREYNRNNVLALNPNQMGVYGLFKPNRWVYIGSGDIRQRLLDHLNGDNPCIAREAPTHWIDEVTANYISREKELMIEYNPICNRQVG